MHLRSPAAALAWEFDYRHRWGLATIAAYFAALATAHIVAPDLLAIEPREGGRFAALTLVAAKKARWGGA
ncbi:MAG: hypothetical protein AB1635_09005 [Acidobacteriota bacterium]